MKKLRIIGLFGVLLSCSISISAVTIEWVSISDVGNLPDTEVMTTDGTTHYGSVNYEYQLGKYEVTNNQYCAFLNKIAKTDTYNLYNIAMSSGYLNSGGILRDGLSGNYTYSIKPGSENKPVNYISFYDALRFANWLHNGQPSGDQSPITTEDGAYDMSLGVSVTRKPEAKIWLPSEDEWYKAAYYKGGGINAGYWDYATRNNTSPINELPPGGINSANYDWHQVTEVGAYAQSTS